MSSAAYMLGWLFIQTAEDQDDIEYGISKLEEAREIRASFRGGPLHPWMEDIYLKLGQAYERSRDYKKALQCYQLLLEVRLRKFNNDHSNIYILETYQLLLTIYTALGDQTGQKVCRKHLKYAF